MATGEISNLVVLMELARVVSSAGVGMLNKREVPNFTHNLTVNDFFSLNIFIDRYFI